VLFNKRFSENQTDRGQSLLVNYLGATTIYAKRLGFEGATDLLNESVKVIFGKREEENNFKSIKLQMSINKAEICFFSLSDVSESSEVLTYPLEKVDQLRTYEQNHKIIT
jgi:hypothetical protein